MMRTFLYTPLVLLILLLAALGSASGAQQRTNAPSCREHEGFRKLDFWIGE